MIAREHFLMRQYVISSCLSRCMTPSRLPFGNLDLYERRQNKKSLASSSASDTIVVIRVPPDTFRARVACPSP